MMTIWYLAMREAAFWRHEVLVNATVPAGLQRDIEHAKHIAFVKLVYGF
jgi:hypothetical protein